MVIWIVKYLVNRKIDILLGDFNVDAFDEIAYARLKGVLCNYILKVEHPTHLGGALLDHVYLLNSFGNQKVVNCVVNNVYFSDHDAVRLQLRFSEVSGENIDFSISSWNISPRIT